MFLFSFFILYTQLSLPSLLSSYFLSQPHLYTYALLRESKSSQGESTKPGISIWGKASFLPLLSILYPFLPLIFSQDSPSISQVCDLLCNYYFYMSMHIHIHIYTHIGYLSNFQLINGIEIILCICTYMTYIYIHA